MSTNTAGVETRARVPARFLSLLPALLALGLPVAWPARAETQIGPWVPLFQGVDHSVSTNIPGATGMPHLLVVNTVRVDLHDPDVRLLTTPRAENYVPGSNETGGRTVSDFLKTHRLQVAINANFFGAREYYLPPGTPMDVSGLQVSEGVVVSEQEGPDNAVALVFDARNAGRMIHSNWPATSTADIFTAVAGEYSLVVAGKNVAHAYRNQPRFIHNPNPRTAFGISEDRRYLYLMTIDGRQPGYSEGAYDEETAEWMLLLGAHDAVNLDGGGSTTLVVEDSTGFPRRLNKSSAVADSGRERTVGSHFGVFAKPLRGFIREVAVATGDTTARVTWTTPEPATSQIEFDTTPALGRSTARADGRVAQHAVELTGLTPATGYYYRIVSTTTENTFTSSTYFFTTTNYVTTNQIFSLEQPWRFTAGAPPGADWTRREFDDSGWSGPGGGLLWVNTRGGGAGFEVSPRVTELPADAGTGFPFHTYYFRTRFTLASVVPGTALAVSARVDDGAVFYLNGQEVLRVRMPDGTVDAQTLASSFPCEGDATCHEEFLIPASALGGLVPGDNVLAAEVHNYNARSADITFGLGLDAVVPVPRIARLSVLAAAAPDAITLGWDQPGFVLESAPALDGPWEPVPGATTSPHRASLTESARYFRLRK